jgi:hypothetical protein
MSLQPSLTAALVLATASTGMAQDTNNTSNDQLQRQIEILFEEIDELKSGSSNADRFSFGGYGEYHANMPRGGDKFSDPHRFVFYMGYEFADGVQLHSETEIEHGFVKDNNGEISLEQLYIDVLVGQDSGLQFGRMLAPLGIINSRHEPSVFNGVERPNFSKYILPSTWSLDGIGYWNQITEELSGSLYLTGGLDGSGFSDKDGIRGGRMKERPGLDNPAISGRLDWRPAGVEGLRVGASFFSGGADNSNKGGEIGVDSSVDIFSVDFEYSIGDFDFRGVYAEDHVSNASGLNALTPGANIGEVMAGYYVEAAYHLLPDSWRSDRFRQSDLIAFVRYEDFDTQDELGSAAVNLAAAREEITIGLGYWLTPDLVFKADYQILDDDTDDRANQLNFGVGWTLR